LDHEVTSEDVVTDITRPDNDAVLWNTARFCQQRTGARPATARAPRGIACVYCPPPSDRQEVQSRRDPSTKLSGVSGTSRRYARFQELLSGPFRGGRGRSPRTQRRRKPAEASFSLAMVDAGTVE
jgi:hypothetical protein